jgi:type II secretory pathway pseudopilin PulG
MSFRPTVVAVGVVLMGLLASAGAPRAQVDSASAANAKARSFCGTDLKTETVEVVFAKKEGPSPKWVAACTHRNNPGVAPDRIRWINRLKEAVTVTFTGESPFGVKVFTVPANKDTTIVLRTNLPPQDPCACARHYDYTWGTADLGKADLTMQQGPAVVTDD